MRYKSIFLITATILLFLVQVGLSQDKIDREAIAKDHYKASSILNPDTLKGDQKQVFDLFSTWTLEEIQNIQPEKLKSELKKIDITTDEPKRFKKVLAFISSIENHRISRNQWREFDDLAPKK